MITVFSPLHAGHGGHHELVAGAIVPAYEKPGRAEMICARIEAVGLGPVRAPAAQTLDTARAVHSPDYLAFLEQAHAKWLARGNSGAAMPFVWPVPGLRRDTPPEDIEGQLGYYSFDGGAPFVAGTWQAVRTAHDAALTAADLLSAGETSAFALTRPPGHHAGSACAGGYCYINNAAVAAQRLRESGARRIAILDIDYHHGNGTQEIFYRRGDVMVVNIHADPMMEFPYFLGHADERGTGDGAGANLNLPLPHGVGWDGWASALEEGCRMIGESRPDALIVSLGVDTFENDPISQFQLTGAAYPRIGARIAALGLPTLYVMEGGYAVAEIGENAVGVLSAHADAASRPAAG